MQDAPAAYPTEVPQEIMYYVEGVVAVFIALVFVISAAISIKERHSDMSRWHILVGAGIYGAIFGAIIGFGIVPMRMMLMEGALPPQETAVFGFAMLLFVIALRRGVIARLPFLGPQVKAYRRASLRRQIETSQKQLDKLTPKDEA